MMSAWSRSPVASQSFMRAPTWPCCSLNAALARSPRVGSGTMSVGCFSTSGCASVATGRVPSVGWGGARGVRAPWAGGLAEAAEDAAERADTGVGHLGGHGADDGAGQGDAEEGDDERIADPQAVVPDAE